MHSFHSLSFVVLIFAAVVVHGQTASPQPAPAPRPKPAAKHEEPVALNEYVISASPFRRNQGDLLQSTGVLSGRSLLLKQRATLGDTLAQETGMSATSFGPGASRPIIRGLGGDRIRILENSVGTIDASVISQDHAVSVEPFLVERIEIVRGPAALLYGSSAVGGVVNVITHRIETEAPGQTFRGGGEVRYNSAAEEWARGGVADLAWQRPNDQAVVLHLDGFRRTAGKVRIPGFAESARIRSEEDAEAEKRGESPPMHARDRLPNSALESAGGALGLSLVGSTFHLGASLSGLDSNYGIPGHAHAHADDEGTPEGPAPSANAEGVTIDLRQRRTDVQGEWRFAETFITTARLKIGHADYRHAEIEPAGAIGTLFAKNGYDGRLELLHGGATGLNGALGLQATRSKLVATGEEAFLPSSNTRNTALFAFEELVRDRITWQAGLRFERQEISSQGLPGRIDQELSASLGAVLKLGETHSLVLSLSRTGRAPNVQELYANGAHAGTQSFEIGDAALSSEDSLGAEFTLRRREGRVTGALTVFANRFNGYVFERPTGFVAIEHEGQWEFLRPDDEEVAEHGGGLPVYRYVQRDAHFWGAEFESLWHMHEESGQQVDVRLAADFTRARDEAGYLPRLPAARAMAGLLWAAGPWTAGADCQWVFDQRRVAAGETPSDGYTLVEAHATYRFTFRRGTYDLFMRGTNLLNEEVRPHTSFVKDLAPMPGRGVTIGIRATF